MNHKQKRGFNAKYNILERVYYACGIKFDKSTYIVGEFFKSRNWRIDFASFDAGSSTEIVFYFFLTILLHVPRCRIKFVLKCVYLMTKYSDYTFTIFLKSVLLPFKIFFKFHSCFKVRITCTILICYCVPNMKVIWKMTQIAIYVTC